MKLIKKDVPKEVHITEDETRYQYIESQSNMRNFARDWAVQYGKEVGLEGDILAGVKDGARREALDAFQRGSHSAGQHGGAPPSQ
ncbi:hypothetical protein IHE61_13200 [Streptomyces sp. GKU 257-1]|nr:hypothetical protein [Streptomyces sp. GKU 257-1]